MGLYGDHTQWFASILVINACCPCGGVTLCKIIGYDAQICHAPKALEREVSILVVEAKEFSDCIVCSDFLILRMK